MVTRFTLRDMMERGESDEESDQVQLMTLHASEGAGVSLRLSGGYGRALPHQSSIDEDNVDEERRRRMSGLPARKELTFTLCKGAVSTENWCALSPAVFCWSCRRMT